MVAVLPEIVKKRGGPAGRLLYTVFFCYRFWMRRSKLMGREESFLTRMK